ncbi:MFS transporter [Phenylobacterium sp. VNQ135]|uniref:MFS transporter n=1 Tax=Phenylobacterium sp. VNQ135 TaxID=3400922 RepID=UPI003C025B40
MIYVSCFLIALMEGFDSQIMALAVPQMAGAWGKPAHEFAIVFSAAGLGMAFGATAVGYLADRFGRRWALIWSMLALGVLTFAIIGIHSLSLLVLLRFLGGICLGGILVNVIAIAGDVSAPETRLRNTLLTYTGAPSGALLGSLVGGYLFRFSDWRLIFIVGGAMALSCIILPLAFLPTGKPACGPLSGDEPNNTGPLVLFSDTYRNRALAHCAAELLAVMGITLLASWLPTIMAEATGSVATASLFTSLVYLGAIVGVVGLAPFLNLVGPKRLLAGIFFIAGAVCVLLNAAIGHSEALTVAYLTVLGVGVIGGQVALHSLGATLYPAHIRGTGVGLALAVGRVGALTGPIIGGAVLATASAKGSIFLVLSGIVLAAACAVAVLDYVTRRDSLELT